ncbi:MAG: response regulator [Syntrophobacteria bacterium]
MREYPRGFTILMAEDDPDDRLLIKEAFEESGLTGKLCFVTDGVELMDYLRNQGQYQSPEAAPRPILILLDLNMPRKDGREALTDIKADPQFRRIPVVVLTTSRDKNDILQSYAAGASSYIPKPALFDELVNMIRILGKYWLEVVQLPV